MLVEGGLEEDSLEGSGDLGEGFRKEFCSVEVLVMELKWVMIYDVCW